MLDNKVFISGYANLPMGITAWELYRVISIGLLLDKDSGEIFDAECSLVTKVAKDFVSEILVGENLNNTAKIEEKINKHYFGSAKKSLITALRICERKYRQIINNTQENME